MGVVMVMVMVMMVMVFIMMVMVMMVMVFMMMVMILIIMVVVLIIMVVVLIIMVVVLIIMVVVLIMIPLIMTPLTTTPLPIVVPLPASETVLAVVTTLTHTMTTHQAIRTLVLIAHAVETITPTAIGTTRTAVTIDLPLPMTRIDTVWKTHTTKRGCERDLR